MKLGRSAWPLAAVLLISLGFVSVPADAQAPMRVGDHYSIDIDSDRMTKFEISRTESGRTYEIQHPGATYIAIHFSRFNLVKGDSVVISDLKGAQSYTLTGKGKMNAGEFWAQHIKGDTARVQFVTGSERSKSGFQIDEYVAGFVDFGGQPESVCGVSDGENAICYATSNPTEYNRARAVARLLIQGSSLCTGWLASSSNHLVTNEHCISSSTAALNTDYEFDAEAPNCGDGNCQLCHPGTVFSGATFIQDNPSLDYALVQITSGNPAATYGFLEIDDRAAIVGEQIYIPQHPAGRAKELGIASTHSSDPAGLCQVNSNSEGACSGTGYQDVGYFCDTEGGSSGSPVLATSSHKVIALHHCRGNTACTGTGGDPNRGVPITLICDEICDLFGPQCVTSGDCDDGDPCTLDSCDGSGSCQNTPQANCCGNGTCELGEDCLTCAADCPGGTTSGAICGNGICEAGDGEDCVTCAADCNGRQNGPPSQRFCCGAGGGQSPVDCSDSRCSADGSSCTMVPQSGGSFCCGDALCSVGETCSNCALDCNGGAEICNDGIDNDCNGDVDCDDFACFTAPICQSTCTPAGGQCNNSDDCCAGLSCGGGRPGSPNRTCR